MPAATFSVISRGLIRTERANKADTDVLALQRFVLKDLKRMKHSRQIEHLLYNQRNSVYNYTVFLRTRGPSSTNNCR